MTPTSSAPDHRVGALRPSHIATGLIEVAARFPDRIALADLDTELTFADVDHLSGRLAETLRVAFESAIGDTDPTDSSPPWLPVFVSQTTTSAIALLAAIRAGRRFVPIDSDSPVERQQAILDRLGAVVVALMGSPSPHIRLPNGCQQIDVSSLASTSIDHVEPQVIDPLAPGGVVFTSGSTGRPKGVVIPWRQVEQRLGGKPPVTSMHPNRHVVLQRLSFTSGLTSLGYLANGETIDLLDGSVVSTPRLLAIIDQRGVTELHTGTTIAGLMVEHARGGRLLPEVHQADFGAGPCEWSLIAGLRSLCSADLVVRVGYNASEAGRIVRREIGPSDVVGDGIASPGVPDDPSRIRLVPDDHSGAPEIWVRDPVSLGYFDDPELTARRFPIDDDGRRWWRSGDVGVVDEHGALHIRGRVDDMVKVHGVRIEPAEAEQALRQIPGIADAVVLPVTTPTGRIRLIGHLRLDQSTGGAPGVRDLDPASIRSELLHRLPPALVPAMFVLHDSIPLNSNGKIDRRLLSTSTWPRWRTAEHHGHRSEFHRWIASQVARIIDLGDVDEYEDVFDAGLDSLGAVELCAMIAEAGFSDISPEMLLRCRTPAALADLLTASADRSGAGSEVPPDRAPSGAVVVNGSGTRPPIFVLPGTGGSSFAFRSLSNELGHDQPVVVLEPRGLHAPGVVATTFDALVSDAVDDAMAHLSDHTSCAVIGYSSGAVLGFEVARRLSDAAVQVEMIFVDGSPARAATMGSGRVAKGLRRRSIREHLTSLQRYPASLRALVVSHWLARHPARLAMRPGAPVYRRERYEAFGLITRAACATSRPTPFDVSAWLVQVERPDDLSSSIRPLVSSLETTTVGGDHYSMLKYPVVVDVADTVRRAVDQLDVNRLDVNR